MGVKSAEIFKAFPITMAKLIDCAIILDNWCLTIKNGIKSFVVSHVFTSLRFTIVFRHVCTNTNQFY